MSRAIKFRVWDSVTKEWQSQYLLSPEGSLCVQAWVGTPAHLELEYLPDRKRNVVELFTGLLDKQGKEIYEGDIVRAQSHHLAAHPSEHPLLQPRVYPVQFGEGAFNVGNPSQLYSCGSIYEIIGNIHEHPNLLRP